MYIHVRMEHVGIINMIYDIRYRYSEYILVELRLFCLCSNILRLTNSQATNNDKFHAGRLVFPRTRAKFNEF